MTPDVVRSLSRAAAQLAALAQPDVAAVLAALPRRPGSTASLAEVGAAAGLEMRAVGRAVARGRDAGVLRVEGDQVGVDPGGPRAAVAALVALTPLGAVLAEHPELAEAAPFGVVHGVPTGDRADELLALLALEVAEGELTEREVTEALSRFGDDPAGLRRALVDAGLLWRTPDGARYRRPPDVPTDRCPLVSPCGTSAHVRAFRGGTDDG